MPRPQVLFIVILQDFLKQESRSCKGLLMSRATELLQENITLYQEHCNFGVYMKKKGFIPRATELYINNTETLVFTCKRWVGSVYIYEEEERMQKVEKR